MFKFMYYYVIAYQMPLTCLETRCLDLLSFALDMSFSKMCVVMSHFVESHIGVYKEYLVIQENLLEVVQLVFLEFFV